MKKTALVLGATGGIGGAIADALWRHDWRLRGLARNVESARSSREGAVEWVQGDAMVAADVANAAAGATVIVHAVNPPGYRDWDRLVLPMIDNTIAAARSTGARAILPGTVYNFDPARTPIVDADTPQQPSSRKGAIRVELERRLQEAAPDVRSLILRAGDYFGPNARSSWFSQAMVKPDKPLTSVLNPARGSGHSWAYLPDLAEAFARLIEVEKQLPAFERVQFAGHVDATGTAMTDALTRAAGRDLRIRRFPWWLMKALAPFGGFPREAAEIAPYWQHPMRFDNTRLEVLIGPEPRTSLEEAVRTTLGALGCLGLERQMDALR